MPLNLLVILPVLILFILAFMLFRTMTFARQLEPVEPLAEDEIDSQAAAEHLSGALRFETIFQFDQKPEEMTAFDELNAYLEQSYPRVHMQLDVQVINHFSLIYTWKGRNPDLAPVVLMAHLDVVPVEAATLPDWEHPPFSGAIADGYVWGRGALDCKMQAVALLETVERLLENGYQPERTVYLCFGHDEEVGGKQGGASIATWFKEQGIQPEAVLDEGMAVVDKILPGVELPVAMIGLGEKGSLTLNFTVESTPGHSSQPPRETAIGILAKGLAFVEAAPLPSRLDHARLLFKGVAPVLPFRLQFVFANLWLFGGMVRKNMEKSPATNAMVRTTTAITVIQAGQKVNVLPAVANAKVNFRLMPGDTIAGICDHIRKAVDDPRVKFEPLEGFISEASSTSRTDTAAYAALVKTIRRFFGGIPVAPALVLGGTDSRYFHAICDSVYRFAPMVVGVDELKRVHGINERISVEGLGTMIRFYDQLIRVWGEPL